MTAPDIVCFGEPLAVLLPETPDQMTVAVGGAEANVAWALAVLGQSATFVSRVGQDPFGDFVVEQLRRVGVRVLIQRDPKRPTGAYVKDSASRMHYYRSGSAATAMTTEIFDGTDIQSALGECVAVHTTGIAAAVADPAVLDRLIDERDRHGFVLSVDLNWRPTLWRDRGTEALTRLVRDADLLLVGADEAEAAWGCSDAADLRDVVGSRPTIVIKDGAKDATEVSPAGHRTVHPAMAVDVVEPIGAGDGFAAGYLSGMAAGLTPHERLGRGHLVASSVLGVRGDHLVTRPTGWTP